MIVQRKAMVYIEPARNYYARYIGRTCTGAFESDRALSADEINIFRIRPGDLMAPEDPIRA